MPETTRLSVRVYDQRLSEENCAIASKSIVIVPALGSFKTSFLSLMLTMEPVNRSPFLRVTCSAYRLPTQQSTQDSEDTTFHTSENSLFCSKVLVKSSFIMDGCRNNSKAERGLCKPRQPLKPL